MRKLLLLTAFVMSFAGSALAEGIPIKFTLDWKIQGVHGWFYLAIQKGYFAAEGLDVTWLTLLARQLRGSDPIPGLADRAHSGRCRLGCCAGCWSLCCVTPMAAGDV